MLLLPCLFDFDSSAAAFLNLSAKKGMTTWWITKPFFSIYYVSFSSFNINHILPPILPTIIYFFNIQFWTWCFSFKKCSLKQAGFIVLEWNYHLSQNMSFNKTNIPHPYSEQLFSYHYVSTLSRSQSYMQKILSAVKTKTAPPSIRDSFSRDTWSKSIGYLIIHHASVDGLSLRNYNHENQH